MRKLLSATVAAAAVAGGALAIGQAAQAQPYYGYYPAPAPTAGYYDRYGYYHPAYEGYRAPAYPVNPYYGSSNGLSAGLAVLGSVLGLDAGAGAYSNVPVDRYGPDPNGYIAADGHKIKCKLRSSYDSYYGRYMTRRECW